MSDDFDITRMFSDAQTEAEKAKTEEAHRVARERARAEQARLEDEKARNDRKAAEMRQRQERAARLNAMPAWRRWIIADPIRAILVIVFSILFLVAAAMVAWSIYSTNRDESAAADAEAARQAAIDQRDASLQERSTVNGTEDVERVVQSSLDGCDLLRVSDQAPIGTATGAHVYCNWGSGSIIVRMLPSFLSVRQAICSTWGESSLGEDSFGVGGNWLASVEDLGEGPDQAATDLATVTSALNGEMFTRAEFCL